MTFAHIDLNPISVSKRPKLEENHGVIASSVHDARFCSRVHTPRAMDRRPRAHMIIYCWKVDPGRRPWRPPLTWASDGGKRRSLCVLRFHGNIMRCHCEGGPAPQIVIYWLKGCEGVIWSSELAPLLGWCCLCRRRWRLAHPPMDAGQIIIMPRAHTRSLAPGQRRVSHAPRSIKWGERGYWSNFNLNIGGLFTLISVTC